MPTWATAIAGTHTVRARLRDRDNGTRDLFATFNVTAVRTELSIDPVANIDEGDSATLVIHAFDPGGIDISSWRIEWGDGSVEELLLPSQIGLTIVSRMVEHTYADGSVNGTRYPIVVTARTPLGEVTANSSLVVRDVAPTVSLTTFASSVVEGGPEPLVVQLSVTDPGNDSIESFFINWGDDTVERVTGETREVSHTYTTRPASGTYAVRIATLSNDDGEFGDTSNELNVTVHNAAPVILESTLQIPRLGDEEKLLDFSAVAVSVHQSNEPLTFTWKITTPGGEVITLSSGLGESILAGATAPAHQYAARSSASFTPSDDGTYRLTLTVSDDDGASTAVSRDIEVSNRPPVIDSFDVPAIGQEGTTIRFSASASDPADAANQLTYTWTVLESATGALIATLHGATVDFLPASGQYRVVLNVTDGDGGNATTSSLLNVAAVAPVLTPGTLQVPAAAVEGQTVSFSVAAADVGDTNNALGYVWTVITPDKQQQLLEGKNVQWKFDDQGEFTVFVTVTDSQGTQTASSPRTITVTNLAPTVATLNVPSTGIESQSLTLTATATDPAAGHDAIIFRWSITTPAGAVINRVGSSATFTPDDEGDYAISLTVADEDGGSQTGSAGTIHVSNDAPTLGAIQGPTGAVEEGDSVSLSVSASGCFGRHQSIGLHVAYHAAALLGAIHIEWSEHQLHGRREWQLRRASYGDRWRGRK